MNQKGFVNIAIILIILAIAGAAGYFVLTKKSNEQNSSTKISSILEKPTLTFIQGGKPFVQINFDYTTAKTFNIYRSTNPSGDWQKIASNVPSSSKIASDYDYPKNVNILFYRITSIDAEGKESDPSSAAFVAITQSQDTTTKQPTSITPSNTPVTPKPAPSPVVVKTPPSPSPTPITPTSTPVPTYTSIPANKNGFLLSGSLCTFDFSLAPQSENNARRLLDFCEKIAPTLETKFGRGPSAPPYKIQYYIPQPGSQGTGGDANAYVGNGQVYLSINYWQTKALYDAEILAHELTHVIQSFYGYNTLEYPGWLIEALADYGAYTTGYSNDLEKNCYHFSSDMQNQTHVYNCTYKFLKFIENKYDSALAFKLNKALQSGNYSENLFVQYTGKTFDQLTAECSQNSDCAGLYRGGL